MAKKKVFEITLHDNGRSECHLDVRGELEGQRLMAAILTIMTQSDLFAEIVNACAEIFSNSQEEVKEAARKSIDAAMKTN
ncbi:MAG: hypothetical protein IJ584_13730 [Bacteroidales bacterium]|nr:hypothetical protein [Bacteroidales bacterium]